LLKYGKTQDRKTALVFPQFQQPQKDWVIDNRKNARLQSGACFPTYQQPDDDKFLIMK